MRQQRFNQSTPYTSESGNAIQPRPFENAFQAGGILSDALFSINERVKSAERNAQMADIVTNFQTKYNEIEGKIGTGQVSIEQGQQEFEDHYGKILENVTDKRVIQEIKPILTRKKSEIDQEFLKAKYQRSIKDAQRAHSNLRLNTSNEYIKASNPQKRAEIFSEYRAFYDRLVKDGVLNPDDPNENIDNFRRSLATDSFNADVQVNPRQAREWLPLYGFDEDQKAKAIQVLDREDARRQSELFQLIQEKVEANPFQEFDLSGLNETQRTAISNQQKRIREYEAKKTETEQKAGLINTILGMMVKRTASPDAINEEILRIAEKGVIDYGDAMNLLGQNQNYTEEWNRKQRFESIMSSGGLSDPFDKETKKAIDENYTKGGTFPDDAMAAQIANKTKIIADSEKAFGRAILSNDTAKDEEIAAYIGRWRGILEAAPEAAVESAQGDPYLSYAMWAAQNITTTNSTLVNAKMVRKFRQNYLQNKDALEELSKSANVTKIIDKAVKGYSPLIQTQMKQQIKSYISYGMTPDTADIQSIVNQAFHYVTTSPLGYGESLISTESLNAIPSIANNAKPYMTYMPPERILGNRNPYFISRILDNFLREELGNNYEESKQHDIGDMYFVNQSIGIPSVIPFTSVNYRLRSLPNSPSTKTFLVEKFRDGVYQGNVQDPNTGIDLLFQFSEEEEAEYLKYQNEKNEQAKRNADADPDTALLKMIKGAIWEK